MDKFFAQMKEYLNMDTEISFEEFSGYYNDLLGHLNPNSPELSEVELHQARFILLNLNTNAVDRAARKGPQAKKYKKMAEKSKFWEDAIRYRLTQMGLTEKQIKDAYASLSD